ncbi:hypothetical protein STEG23_022039 [Scotinomys teguina]
MQPGRTTNTGGGTMEVVAAAPRCQLLLIVLMAVMLLPGMKGSPLLVQRTVTRTIVLQETIGKGYHQRSRGQSGTELYGSSLDKTVVLPLNSYSSQETGSFISHWTSPTELTLLTEA